MSLPWTDDDVARIGTGRKMFAANALHRAHAMQSDVHRELRLALRQCPYCYYLDHRLDGLTCVGWTCRGCGEESMHAGMPVPMLCEECADRLAACVKCGGNRDWNLAWPIEGPS